MKKIKGFTLIESVIAMLLITIIAISAFEFYRYCQTFVIDTELRLMALNLARQEMEHFHWDRNPTGAYTEEDLVPPLPSPHVGTKTYSIDPGPGGNYQILKITVDWN